MQTMTISATKARNDFFNIFSAVYSGIEVFVEKDKKQMIKMIPVTIPNSYDAKMDRLAKAMNKTHGILKKFDLDKSPFRGRKSIEWLGKWDQ